MGWCQSKSNGWRFKDGKKVKIEGAQATVGVSRVVEGWKVWERAKFWYICQILKVKSGGGFNFPCYQKLDALRLVVFRC